MGKSNDGRLIDAEKKISVASYFLGKTGELLVSDPQKSICYLQTSVIFAMSAKRSLFGEYRTDYEELESLQRYCSLQECRLVKTVDGPKLYSPRNKDAIEACSNAVDCVSILLYQRKWTQGIC
jgi:hypothetical protein